MGRRLTPERQHLKAWALELARLGLTQERIGQMVGVPQYAVSRMLSGEDIVHTPCFIVHKSGKIMHNSGVIMHNVSQDHPVHPEPILRCARAESLPLPDDHVDLIITSPPYNLGAAQWDMGGNNYMNGHGRPARKPGIGYTAHDDAMPEDAYQHWQLTVLQECYRVAAPGASMFYNHKVRQRKHRAVSPLEWLGTTTNPWMIRQEIIWDRCSTHNHNPGLFWQHTERIYWLTKGRPTLPDHSVGMPDIWAFHGPVAGAWHPAPFPPELPRRCLQALGRPGITVLDPFGGSMTTCLVAHQLGYHAIGVDIDGAYIAKARSTYGWQESGGERETCT